MRKCLNRVVLISVFIGLLLGSSVTVSAQESPETNGQLSIDLETNELPIPTIEERNMRYIQIPYLLNSEESLNSLREQWIEQTIRINEEHFEQKSNTWYETEDYYIIEFEPKQIITENKELDRESLETTEVSVMSIEYLKPESSLNKHSDKLALQGVAAQSTLPTKIISYYAWSNGYYTVGSKSGNTFASIANLALAYTPIKSKLVSWIVGEAVGSLFNSFDQSKPVQAEAHNKYFYLNKAGSVYKANTWLPVAHVGSRRAFAWSWATVRTSQGEPIVRQNGPKNGNGLLPPTNYDSIEYKTNFNSNTWIINKALETHNIGGYWDCYAIAYTAL